MARYVSAGRLHLGVGAPGPFRPTGGKLGWVAHEDAIERSIVDILQTTPGERVMLPTYGAGLRQLVFAPNSGVTHAEVAHQVKTAIQRWEPRVDVENVTVTTSDEEPNLLLIDVDYVVRSTNAAVNLVYPFYLSEGV